MKEAQVELEKSYRAMEKANIDLQDKLIGQGYSADTTGIPTAILRNVKISSGMITRLISWRQRNAVWQVVI